MCWGVPRRFLQHSLLLFYNNRKKQDTCLFLKWAKWPSNGLLLEESAWANKCSKSATKMIKLDLFIISESLLSLCPNISAVSLDRYLSDHLSILMRESYYDYGHVPFRFFHYWFDMEGFDKLVEESWKAAPVADTNAIIKMMKKLKYLKENIHKGKGDEDVVNRLLREMRILSIITVSLTKRGVSWLFAA
ncbi:hypothetical protein Tco_0442727, partial [Tanacetum coccineum]